jgi:hypothetical protein
MKRLTALLVLVSSFVVPSVASAGPWSPAPGHGYAKLWLKWLPGFGYHAGNGDTIDYGAYHEVFLNGYAELGVVDKLAATLHFPFAQAFSLEDPRDGSTERHVTVGDPALGARYQALSLGRFALALETFARAPIAPAGVQQIVYARDDGRPIGGLRIGAGVWDVYAGLALGYGWDRVYVAATLGYIVRTGGYHDVSTFTAEVGGRLSKRFQGRLRITGYQSLDEGSAPRHESPSGIGNGTSYVGFALEGEYEIRPRWFLGLGLQGGAGLIYRQTGGPVIDYYVATVY